MSPPALTCVTVHDEPRAWSDLGFTVTDATIDCDGVALDLVARAERPRGGLGPWSFTGLREVADLDGIPTTARAAPSGEVAHANGVVALDHVVIVTPDCDRTIGAFERAGIEVRRVRHTDQYGPPFRQTFFRAGPTILELVGPDVPDPADARPAHLYGLAFTVDDLDATASFLGARLGRVKDAVQPGRRIATVHATELGVSPPIVVMSR